MLYIYIYIYLYVLFRWNLKLQWIGWHRLSNATCLIRPHLCFSLCQGSPLFEMYLPCLKQTCVRQVVLDKWFPLSQTS